MTALLFLFRRYLWPKEGNLMNRAIWVSSVGVALGVCLLIIVLSVMGGFLKIFEKNYTRITSQLVVIPNLGTKLNPDFRMTLLSIPGIEAITPFGLGQAMIIKEGIGGVTLEGIDIESSKNVTDWENIFIEKPNLEKQKKDAYWIWLGVQLATKLNVKVGDRVQVLVQSRRGKKIMSFSVTAITKFGIYDHDLRYARIDLRILKEIFRTHYIEPMYKCRIKNESLVEEIKEMVENKLNANVKKWSEIHKNIFLAVKHQKSMLFHILVILIALSAVNVINLLIMSSHYRRRDIAILRTMGMKIKNILLFFVAQGALVGTIGIFMGIFLGYISCALIEYFQPVRLSEKIYNVTKLPIEISLYDVLLISIISFIICTIFSFIPALNAAFSRPVNVLRDE